MFVDLFDLNERSEEEINYAIQDIKNIIESCEKKLKDRYSAYDTFNVLNSDYSIGCRMLLTYSIRRYEKIWDEALETGNKVYLGKKTMKLTGLKERIFI